MFGSNDVAVHVIWSPLASLLEWLKSMSYVVPFLKCTFGISYTIGGLGLGFGSTFAVKG